MEPLKVQNDSSLILNESYDENICCQLEWIGGRGIFSTSSAVLAGTTGTEPQRAAQDKNM